THASIFPSSSKPGPTVEGSAPMAKAIIHMFLNAALFLLLANLLPGFHVSGWGAAILASLVLGLVNATFGLVLKILTFPLILLTFGLFSFVVNAIVILLVAFLVPGLDINGFLPALIAAVALSALNLFWRMATTERMD
ncbi:MAG TPA: phage holin family protein, partial [Candidatus Eisenbacteria bacterium]|nr:phage holin family protein [Candidatus Eisenbacteria bacterium]